MGRAREPQRQEHQLPKIANWQVPWLVLAILACMVSGCNAPHSPGVLPPLHASGVVPIAGLQSVRGDDPADTIVGLAAYQSLRSDSGGGSGSASTTRLVVATSEQVYDIGLDGANPRRVSLQSNCYPYGVSVTPDGQHAVCTTQGDTAPYGMLLFAPQVPGDSGRLLALAPNAHEPRKVVNYAYPSWAPDGIHLAVVWGSFNDCTIAIVTVDAHSATFQPTAYLSMGEDNLEECRLDDLAWSPDGHWLAFGGRATSAGGPNALYALSLSTFSLFGHESSPVTLRIPQNAVVDVTPNAGVAAWLPGPSPVLTFPSGIAYDVDRLDVATGQTGLVLHLDLPGNSYTRFCAIAWTPDGMHLVFAYCQPGDLSVPGPPAQLYVYTPPAGLTRTSAATPAVRLSRWREARQGAIGSS